MPSSSSAELRAFDAAARAGSMSAAARQIGLRQPTVSAHIASLERSFGVELFHRVGGRIELTGFGVLLQEATGRMFRGEEQAQALLLGARHKYESVLAIGGGRTLQRGAGAGAFPCAAAAREDRRRHRRLADRRAARARPAG